MRPSVAGVISSSPSNANTFRRREASRKPLRRIQQPAQAVFGTSDSMDAQGPMRSRPLVGGRSPPGITRRAVGRFAALPHDGKTVARVDRPPVNCSGLQLSQARFRGRSVNRQGGERQGGEGVFGAADSTRCRGGSGPRTARARSHFSRFEVGRRSQTCPRRQTTSSVRKPPSAGSGRRKISDTTPLVGQAISPATARRHKTRGRKAAEETGSAGLRFAMLGAEAGGVTFGKRSMPADSDPSGRTRHPPARQGQGCRSRG